MLGGGKENRALVPQIDFHARLHLQFVDELGIQARAGCGQRLQSGERFGRAIDQHAASGVRRFAAGLAPLDYNDTRAFAPELNRQREPNNAAADYDYIPIPHLRIVEESVTFVTRVVTLLPPIIRSNLLDNEGQENQPE